MAEAAAEMFQTQGLPPLQAALAAHIGLACYRAARATAGSDPATLKPALDAAFDHLQQT